MIHSLKKSPISTLQSSITLSLMYVIETFILDVVFTSHNSNGYNQMP